LIRQPTHTTASTVCDRARNLPYRKAGEINTNINVNESIDRELQG